MLPTRWRMLLSLTSIRSWQVMHIPKTSDSLPVWPICRGRSKPGVAPTAHSLVPLVEIDVDLAMFVLGVNLPERKLVRIALTRFVGIGHHTANLICARLQLHPALTVADLSEHQIGRISALLSSPPTTPPTNHELAPFDGIPAPSTLDFDSGPTPKPRLLSKSEDPLQRLIIESDLRREVRANIAHHRAIGSYRGKRHALGFPVNGQRTHTNAKTARKLNRVERRAFSACSSNSSLNRSPSSILLVQVKLIDPTCGFSALKKAPRS